MMIILCLVMYVIGSITMFSTMYQLNEEPDDEFSKMMAIHVSSVLWPVTLLATLLVMTISFLKSFNAPK